jgi:hypothetical protein
MSTIARDLNRPLKDVTWPQDTLLVPRGNGQMPGVDTTNAVNVGREYFTYSGQTTGDIGAGESQIINIPIAKDGDFWMNSMIVDAYATGSNIHLNAMPNGDVQITDSLTRYRFFNPSIPLGGMAREVNVGVLNTATVFINPIIEPYCFVRSSNILVDVALRTTQFVVGRVTLFFAFSGWKEYANASF